MKIERLLIPLFLLGSVGLYGQQALTLDGAIDLALNNSPDVRRSELNLDRNNESLNAELSRLKSNFSLNITPIDFGRRREFNDLFSTWYTNETFSYGGGLSVRQPIVATDGILTLSNNFKWQNSVTQYQGEVTNKAYSNNLFLSYTQPLFTYNRTKLALKELEYAAENAAINFSIQKLNIERSVSQSYFNVFLEQESLAIAIEEYENQQANYEIIKNKTESGLAAREELFQAEVNMANSKSALQNQEVSLENTKDDFKLLLGMDLYGEISLSSDIEAQLVEVDLSVAIENGLRSRQEIRQREIDMEFAKNDMTRTLSTNEFRGDLSLSVGLFGEDQNLPDIYGTPTNSPSASLTLSIPIWDWGEKKSRIKATEASIKTETLNMSDQRNNIIIGIRRSFRSLQNLGGQIDIAEQSVRNSELTYDINQERYANGDITGLELNQYQNQLSQAKIDLITAKINYRLELLNMKIQSLWDFESNSSIVPDEIK